MRSPMSQRKRNNCHRAIAHSKHYWCTPLMACVHGHGPSAPVTNLIANRRLGPLGKENRAHADGTHDGVLHCGVEEGVISKRVLSLKHDDEAVLQRVPRNCCHHLQQHGTGVCVHLCMILWPWLPRLAGLQKRGLCCDSVTRVSRVALYSRDARCSSCDDRTVH
jgi:hypothetical protein